MNCTYCGRDDWHGKVCGSCGALQRDEPQPERFDPWQYAGFPYKGHWVTIEHGGLQQSMKVHWWLGPQLMAVVPISQQLLREMFGPEDGNSDTYDKQLEFLYQLYLVAVGESKQYVQRMAERNQGIREAFFMVRLFHPDPDPDEPQLLGLSLKQLRELAASV